MAFDMASVLRYSPYIKKMKRKKGAIVCLRFIMENILLIEASMLTNISRHDVYHQALCNLEIRVGTI